jgi:hypothetical protein
MSNMLGSIHSKMAKNAQYTGEQHLLYIGQKHSSSSLGIIGHSGEHALPWYAAEGPAEKCSGN